MVKPARKPARVSHPRVAKIALALLFVPAVVLSACAPNEPVAPDSDIPSTPPPVWTGSTSPSAAAGSAGEGESPSVEGAPLEATLELADGTPVATATFEFSPGYVTITVETLVAGAIPPGFHGLHIHSVGVCEADSTPPAGGQPGDFLSAGGHFNAPGHSGHPASGDLTSLQVREDGSATLVTTTDAFTEEDLLAGAGTSIMIHEGADNFGNIPEDKYAQVAAPDQRGPDEQTLMTGDAGGRLACGVIGGE
ncbi:MAG: superoxide dismutase[Cu-Zn] [Mycobacterium sp.]